MSNPFRKDFRKDMHPTNPFRRTPTASTLNSTTSLNSGPITASPPVLTLNLDNTPLVDLGAPFEPPAPRVDSFRQFDFGFDSNGNPNSPAMASISTPSHPPAYAHPSAESPPPYTRFPSAPKPTHARWTAASRHIFHHHHQRHHQLQHAQSDIELSVAPKSDSDPLKRRLHIRRLIILSTILFLLFLTIILASTLGTRRNPRAIVTFPMPVSTADVPLLGSITVQPYRMAERLSTCISPAALWSCALPPDTTFPVTTASNEGFRVPEFRLIISDRADLTVPVEVPDDKDYALVATADNVLDAGEKTDYFLTMTTTTGAGGAPSMDAGMVRTPSQLLPPVLSGQPLRLFNKGMPDEHYGMHSYFQKSIHFLNNNTVQGNVAGADSGGIEAAMAGYRVTWYTTRFKVKVWTKRAEGMAVDVWVDRVGGEVREKDVISYHLDTQGTVNQRKLLIEKDGTRTDTRGCYCRWGNYRLD